MQQGIVFSRARAAVIVIASVVVGSAVAVAAQGGTGAAGADGSLAGVTAELRQLRLAVEESTRRQTQAQAVGVYLSAQQSRVVHVSARLDAARRELDAVTVQSKELAAELASREDAALRLTNPDEKSQIEIHARMLKQHLEVLGARAQLAQTREAELSQMLHAEEARWTDLVGRLEQLVRK